MEKLDRNSCFLDEVDDLLYTIGEECFLQRSPCTLQRSILQKSGCYYYFFWLVQSTGEWDITWIYMPRDQTLGAYMKLRYQCAEYFENRVNEENELWAYTGGNPTPTHARDAQKPSEKCFGPKPTLSFIIFFFFLHCINVLILLHVIMYF